MKYVYLALGVLFLLFALVQLNDADPVLWFLMYISVTAHCFFAFQRKYFPRVAIVMAVLFLAWGIYLIPPSLADWWQLEEEAQSLKMKMPGVEEARESMGLILSAVVLVFMFIRGRKR